MSHRIVLQSRPNEDRINGSPPHVLIAYRGEEEIGRALYSGKGSDVFDAAQQIRKSSGTRISAQSMEKATTRFREVQDRLVVSPEKTEKVAGNEAELRLRLAHQPFPLEIFQQPLRQFIVEGARDVGVDPSYLAVGLLPVLGLAIGNTRRISLKTTRAEPTVFWASLCGESGEGKSPALDLLMAPLVKLQSEAYETYQRLVEAWERDKKTAKTKNEPFDEPEPELTSVFVTDVTLESLIIDMSRNPRGSLLSVDELRSWFYYFARYGSKDVDGASAKWLELHGGRPCRYKRKTGNHKDLFVPAASLNVLGSIQPGRLAEAFSPSARQSGLAARIIVAYPPTCATALRAECSASKHPRKL